MSLPAPFRFSFKADPTTWYYWESGFLQTSATERYFDAPDKWRLSEVSWTRSLEARGLIRKLASPYNYLTESASMLRSLFYNGSIENKVYFLIERLSQYSNEYEEFFSGRINLATYSNGAVYNGRPRSVTAATIEGGIAQQLDTAANLSYDIPLEDFDSDFMYFEGLTLRGSYRWLLTPLGSTFSLGQGMLAMAQPFVLQEGDYPVATTNSPTLHNMGGYSNSDWGGASGGSGDPVDYAYANFLLEAGQDMDARVYFYTPTFYYSNTSGAGQVVKLKVEVIVVPSGASPYAFSQRAVIYQDANLNAGSNRTVAIDVSSSMIALNAGDRVYLVAYFFLVSGPGAASVDFNYAEGKTVIETEFKLPDTKARCYTYETLIKKLLYKITGLNDILVSNFFNNPNLKVVDCYPANLRVTSGDALRELYTNAAGVATTPAIRISWNNLVKDMRCRLGLGYSVREGLVVISPVDHFFRQDTILADVGEVKSFTDEPARDYFSSSGKWGYPTRTYDKLNGLDEPNTAAEWKYPQISLPKEDDNLCPFRSDMYGIEYTRSNLANKLTTDSASDNDTFVIETEALTSTYTEIVGGLPVGIAAYAMYRPQNLYAQPAQTGLLFYETAYNLTQSPKRNLLRSGNVLRSMLYHLDNEFITFQTIDKNSKMSIDLGSGVITESANIRVSDLPAPFMKPQLFHIEAVMRQTFVEAMRLNPDGAIRFYENGIAYKGYPIEVGVKGPDDNSYNMTLLCTADTDLTPRIV